MKIFGSVADGFIDHVDHTFFKKIVFAKNVLF